MSNHLRHLVLEMSVGMFAYVLILGVLAVIFQNGLGSMGFLLGPVLVGLFLGGRADADPYGQRHGAGRGQSG